MADYTSLIPGNSPIPDPQGPKYVGLIVSIVISLALISFIGFIVYEFFRDVSGDPLSFEPVSAPTDFEEEPDPLTGSLAVASRFRLLSPSPGAKISGNEVTVLCTWRTSKNPAEIMPLASMPLWVDELPMAWSVQFGENTWLARFKLGPGEHRLRTPIFETPFYVDTGESLEEAPARWKPFFMHENIGDEKSCDDCHYWIDRPEDLVRPGHALTIGAWKGGESCMNCHKMETFDQEHLHKFRDYKDCRLCHVLHGTTETEKPLLKAPKSRLCVQCHEAP